MRLRILALAVLAIVAVQPRAVLSQAPPAPEASRLAAAKAMMEAAGVAGQLDQLMPVLFEQMGRTLTGLRPDKAPEIREVLASLVKRFIERKGELIGAVAALYAGALAEEDLKAVTDFYNSPAGMRFKAVQPDIARQAMLAGQRWGEHLGREIDSEARRELKRRGIEL
ncbi:MAG: DUF2059 domain-containing protein [Hyphomicrobiaceae bacterium]|nr:DUF2059 domain-containing protein [Hyphomicrobiaceae bacterium]